MEFKDTVDLMLSNDYKNRFKAEIYQLKIRIDKLENLLNNYFDSPFQFSCSYDLLHEQLIYMQNYYNILLKRAKIEQIELEK